MILGSILKTYKDLLASDPLLTPPIAAIEALITLLATIPPSTISETLSLLTTASTHLKDNVSNPLPVTAGTDLFQRYIISTLQTRSSSIAKSGRTFDRSRDNGDDFQAIRSHLLANSRLFVQRAKEARGVIAKRASGYIRDGVTIVTFGYSRVVSAVLDQAAEEHKRFQVIYVEGSAPKTTREQGISHRQQPYITNEMRQRGVPVAVIPFERLATAIRQATFAVVGTESLVENGGVVSRVGTYQMGLLAQSAGKPFYVVAESYKFVRVYPLDEKDVEIRGQGDLDFRTTNDEKEVGAEHGVDSKPVDFTPPELITALITESGVQTPSAVSEELIKIWD